MHPGIFTYNTQTHFDDLDGLWVMHHSKYLVFLERAVMGLFYQAMQTETFDPTTFPDLYQVVRNVDIHYVLPIANVQPFTILLTVEKLREAGLTLRFVFTDTARNNVYARGRRTCCKMSQQTHTPTGWTPQFRTAYEHLETSAKNLDAEYRKLFG